MLTLYVVSNFIMFVLRGAVFYNQPHKQASLWNEKLFNSVFYLCYMVILCAMGLFYDATQRARNCY